MERRDAEFFLYNRFNGYLRREFGCRVQKIPLNAGLGCPNREGEHGGGGCIYCNASGAAARPGKKPGPIGVQMRQGIQNSLRRYKNSKFIAYFQAFTNTHAPPALLKALYEEALGADPRVVGLAVGTRPDCLSPEIWELLRAYNRRCHLWLELGLQSAHNATLERIARGHTREQFTEAADRARSLGIRVCAHVILGLPGEDSFMMRKTAEFLNERGVAGVKIHNLYFLKNTRLAELYRTGRAIPLSRAEYVTAAAGFLARLLPDIVIQRLVSDPPAAELLAPPWALEKRETLLALEREMREQGLRQGLSVKKKRATLSLRRGGSAAKVTLLNRYTVPVHFIRLAGRLFFNLLIGPSHGVGHQAHTSGERRPILLMAISHTKL